ncbi:uncharacterized protein [Dermacentor andersoni]|uniref:uncharacterized protein n=1 Tax=Dermacentor andersoni TaxID=34620 RepID=UPI003B3A93B7
MSWEPGHDMTRFQDDVVYGYKSVFGSSLLQWARQQRRGPHVDPLSVGHATLRKRGYHIVCVGIGGVVPETNSAAGVDSLSASAASVSRCYLFPPPFIVLSACCARFCPHRLPLGVHAAPLFLRVSGCQSAGSNLISFFDFTFYHGKANPDRKLADEFRRLQSHKLDTITAKCLAMTEQPHYLLISALNVRSLAAHAKDVHHDHILRHSSVLCFAETWMDPEEPLEIIDFLYCFSARRDHNRAAGVAIYLRTGLSAIPVEMFGTSHEVGELCAAKLPNGLLVVAAYFAPTALTKDVVHFLQLALTVHRSTPMLVVGDFNVDIKTNSNFLTLMRENIPFLSLVTRPTAVTTSRGTCIDLVFENQALVYQVEHISVYFSDHKASFMTVKNC